MHFNHKWNKWVSTITSLWLDLLLRVSIPHLWLLYMWVQKQVTCRSTKIKYAKQASGGKVPWEKLSRSLCLPEKRERRVWTSCILNGIDVSDWLKCRASKVTSAKKEVLSFCRTLLTSSSRRGVFRFTSDTEMPSSLVRLSRVSSPFSWTNVVNVYVRFKLKWKTCKQEKVHTHEFFWLLNFKNYTPCWFLVETQQEWSLNWKLAGSQW